MQFRSFFKQMFGRKEDSNISNTSEKPVKLISHHTSRIMAYTGNLMQNDISRVALRTISTHTAKLTPKHIYKGTENPKPVIKELLRRPNRYMSMQDFLAKWSFHLDIYYNVFVYVRRDEMGRPVELFPIPYSTVELVEVLGEIYIKFWLRVGGYITIPYTDIMHFRQDFFSNDFYGDNGTLTLDNVMNVVTSVDEGLVKSANNSGINKWIMKFNSIIKKEHKLDIEEFVRNYISIEKASGVVPTDPRYDLEQVIPHDYSPAAAGTTYIRDRVYSYFGVNEDIVMNKFDENKWNAFYSAKIEPRAMMLSHQFTHLLFTAKEKAVGNEIIFGANKLTYASNETKINMARELIPLGVLTLNQALEIFELPTIGEKGDRRVQTLNVANVDIIDQYQIDRAKKGGLDKNEQINEQDKGQDESV